MGELAADIAELFAGGGSAELPTEDSTEFSRGGSDGFQAGADTANDPPANRGIQGERGSSPRVQAMREKTGTVVTLDADQDAVSSLRREQQAFERFSGIGEGIVGLGAAGVGIAASAGAFASDPDTPQVSRGSEGVAFRARDRERRARAQAARRGIRSSDALGRALASQTVATTAGSGGSRGNGGVAATTLGGGS